MLGYQNVPDTVGMTFAMDNPMYANDGSFHDQQNPNGQNPDAIQEGDEEEGMDAPPPARRGGDRDNNNNNRDRYGGGGGMSVAGSQELQSKSSRGGGEQRPAQRDAPLNSQSRMRSNDAADH